MGVSHAKRSAWERQDPVTRFSIPKVLLGVLAVLAFLVAAYLLYARLVVNPRVVEELQSNPQGERAARAMLVTLPDGRRLPVNYLEEGGKVFVGVDGRWWREFRDGGAPVTLEIRGRILRGHATAVLDDQVYVDEVFSRLRPTGPEWLPNWLNGKLIVINLDGFADQTE